MTVLVTQWALQMELSLTYIAKIDHHLYLRRLNTNITKLV